MVLTQNICFKKLKQMIVFDFIKDKFIKILKNPISTRYLLFGFLNTAFAYFATIFFFLILKEYIIDYLIFLFTSILNITFSFFTMSLFVFNNELQDLTIKKYGKYLSSSAINILIGILISTLLIRIGLSIFITQFITISTNILIQFFINFFILKKN